MQKVLRAMEVKQEGLKMSVCSDFVEHIWKPGSCQNCFCPRNFHQLQILPLLDQQGYSGHLQDLNGIGAKSENTPLEDDSVISLSYSKPTIAVKPTMINSDVSGVWVEGNLNADISQNQDTVVNAFKVANVSEDNQRLPSLGSNCHGHDSVYNHLPSEKDFLPRPPETLLKSSNAFGLSQGSPCCLLLRASDPIENKHTDTPSVSAELQLSFQVSQQKEPIYAESSKRKKVLRDNANALKSDAVTVSPSNNQEDGRQKAVQLSCERNFKDSSAQGAATITIMAPHSEDDNRAFFLSSPDSAVGVQWPCVSSAFNPEMEKTLPFFKPRELLQESCEMNSRDRGLEVEAPMDSKNMSDETPVSPKSEESLPQSVSSSTAGICHLDSPRNEVHGPVTLTSQMNNVFLEDSNRGPPSSGSERRPKNYRVSWHRQCRTEEEQKRMVESEMISLPHFSNCHQMKTCSVQTFKTGGMSRSATFAFDFPKEINGPEEVAAPRLPPKKPPRRNLEMIKNTEIEKLNWDSAENLRGAASGDSQDIHVSFRIPSTSSLNLDTDPFHNEAHFSAFSSEERPPCKSLQPPPLPEKKTVSRTLSSPDGFYWGSSPLARAAIPMSAKLNFSQSESNVCIEEESSFGSNLENNHHVFSSYESLEKTFKGPKSPFLCSSKNNRTCSFQNTNLVSRSFSQHSVSTQVPSGSSLQLHNLLSNINNKEEVYTKLGRLYAESLRRLVLKYEDYFMHAQRSEQRFSENYWPFFKLTCNKPCCNAGDAVYFCATCAKDPSSTYAVKICTLQDVKAATSNVSPSIPIHFNIQQDCGHFVASVPSSLVKNAPVEGQCPPCVATEQECVVVITREVPHQTAADFVRTAETSHKAEPDPYERRVCFLLLQLCSGLEHLKEYGVIHRDLCLENLLLVHCKPPLSCNRIKEDKHLPRLLITNFLKAMQTPGTAEFKAKKNQARLAPEIVSASQYKKFDEFQTGILIYELLHQPNPFEVQTHLREQGYSHDDLPKLPNLSIYSQGLQKLAHLLLEADPMKRIHITEAKRILQCLLWGPRKDLTDQPLNQEEALRGALHNWIDMKRALLMMKLAERAVNAESSVELDDWLCCQYLTSADPSSLLKSLKFLQLL